MYIKAMDVHIGRGGYTAGRKKKGARSPDPMFRLIASILPTPRGTDRKRKRDDDADEADGAPAAAEVPPPAKRGVQSLTVLFRHPKNPRIRLHNSGGVPSLSFDGVRIYGLLRRAKAVFYPSYNYETAHRVDRDIPQGDYTLTHTPDGARKGGKSHSLGSARGSAVDDDLRLWVNNPTAFKARKTHPPMCVDIINAFEEWGWTGIWAQFTLVAEDIGVWTPADMIAAGPDGTPILVEIKTGYRDYLYRYSGMMEGPLSDKPDTPMNQHFLQVGLEMLMALYGYGFRFTKSYVIQAINDLGVVPHKLPAWFYERERAIWDYFSTRVLAGDGAPTAHTTRPVSRAGPRTVGFSRHKTRR